MEIRETLIPGCFEITPSVLRDERGSFVKIFNYDMFLRYGLVTAWKEDYYSVSGKGVLRGLHFQLPPFDCEKVVCCAKGCVLDVVVDLRSGSPTYGRHDCIELRDDLANMMYIPRGLAHGFYVLSNAAIMMYKAGSVYSSEHDSGIRWNSVSIPWPNENPILSKRDSEFEALSDFMSPFVYGNNP